VTGVIIFDGISRRTNTSGSSYHSYRGDVDCFLVVCIDLNGLYFVEADEVNTNKSLRVDPANNDHPEINWAEDYEFDNQWPGDVADGNLPPHRRGDATEALVIAELLKREISIAIPPTDNERYDLLAGTGENDYYRIQIKTGWLADGVIHFQGVSSHTNSQGNMYKPYDDDVDYFIIYVPTVEELYLVGEHEFGRRITLRLDTPDTVHYNINWAEDFEFDRNWPPSGRPIISRQSVIGVGISAFVDLGSEVTRPVDDSVAYDILVEGNPLKYHRVAIVPSWPSRGCLRLKPETCAGIDYFLMICRDLGAEYLIDADEFDRSISLRVEPPEKPDPTIRDAREYELARRWPPNARDRHL